MVVNDWISENLIWITLVITIIVLIYFVFTIIQIKRKKRRFVSQLNVILLILGLMFIIFLTYRASEIEGADWGQIILMIGLVAITAAYASSAEKQAKASVKMAEEMREQRLNMDKPIIVLDTLFGTTRGKYFVKAIKIGFRNEGRGSAFNLELSIDHPLYSFNKYRHLVPVDIGGKHNDCDLRVEKPDVDDDPQVNISPEALAIANYEDASGNPWHSTLELLIVGNTQDIQPGRMQVGVSGHRNTGGFNQND